MASHLCGSYLTGQNESEYLSATPKSVATEFWGSPQAIKALEFTSSFLYYLRLPHSSSWYMKALRMVPIQETLAQQGEEVQCIMVLVNRGHLMGHLDSNKQLDFQQGQMNGKRPSSIVSFGRGQLMSGSMCPSTYKKHPNNESRILETFDKVWVLHHAICLHDERKVCCVINHLLMALLADSRGDSIAPGLNCSLLSLPL